MQLTLESWKKEAVLTQNPDIPDQPNTVSAADNFMKIQRHPLAKNVQMSNPGFFRNPDIQASAPKASADTLTPEVGSRKPETVRAPASPRLLLRSQKWCYDRRR